MIFCRKLEDFESIGPQSPRGRWRRTRGIGRGFRRSLPPSNESYLAIKSKNLPKKRLLVTFRSWQCFLPLPVNLRGRSSAPLQWWCRWRRIWKIQQSRFGSIWKMLPEQNMTKILRKHHLSLKLPWHRNVICCIFFFLFFFFLSSLENNSVSKF